jgi:hypothetical protein
MRRAFELWAVLVAGLLLAGAAQGQAEETRTLEMEGGARVDYVLRLYPAGAHLVSPGAKLIPTSALDAAKLLNLHLASGDVEEAALLSNAPRRRFEVLGEYRKEVGEEEFKRVFSRYLAAETRLVAEIAIDRHRLLIWELPQAKGQLAGQYFVEVDGNYVVDDVPNDTRTRLRWVLEAYRAGKLPAKSSN